MYFEKPENIFKSQQTWGCLRQKIFSTESHVLTDEKKWDAVNEKKAGKKDILKYLQSQQTPNKKECECCFRGKAMLGADDDTSKAGVCVIW